MSLTVRALLELPVVQRARPELVAGSDAQLDREVRWVHTSEIYEISPLLKGGEVLLTTGLGLVAAGTDAVRRYVRALGGTGIAALFFELGRTFTEPPPALVETANAEGLVVVVLHTVVPFIEITEHAHPLISGAEVDRLRLAERATDELIAGMVAGEGLPGLAARLAGVLGCDVAVTAADGELLAGTAAVAPDPLTTYHVAIGDGAVATGRLTVDGPITRQRQTVIDRALPLLMLELQRGTAPVRSRDEAGTELLADVLAGRYESAAEVTRRGVGVGVVVAPGSRVSALYVTVAGGARPPAAIVNATRTAARRVFGSALVAADERGALVGVTMRRRELRAAVRAFAGAVHAELTPSDRLRLVVSAGPLVDDLAGLAHSAASARDITALARRLTPGAEVVFADDFGLYQLLARLVDDEALERFVRDQIGTLIDHDARTGSELVRTLDTYLANGLSKSAAAAALGVRRQTLYNRLDRIGALLGGALDGLDTANRERRTAIDLALVSWRLRTSGATVTSVPSAAATLRSPRPG